MSFLSDIEPYEDAVLAGVRLPEIDIEEKYYRHLGLPNDADSATFLRKLCKDKLKTDDPEYVDRLEMELGIFEELGFVDYILLNWDILNFCHENDIPTGAGRGSAAGSLVLYILGVTKVDPIKYGLFFERFVSKSRAKKIEHKGITYLDGSLLPDVDNDISYDRRPEAIKYIEKKHKGRTSKILTLNTLSSKLCIKECGKIVGEYSESEVNEVSDMIPKHHGNVAHLDIAVEQDQKFAEWAAENEKVFRIAKKLENLNKNTGVHPSGIAISYYKIDEVCPMQRTGDGDLVAGYDMHYVAELMVKFDILGLRTLGIVNETCKQLGIDMMSIDPEDPFIYECLQDLRTPHGLFQISADTNYKVCKKVQPDSLEKLSAVVAIARPGALDFTDQYATYSATGVSQIVHDFFEEELLYTGGIPLYQEQLMKMAVKIGFTLDEAEQLRRIVGKKKADQMPAWKSKIEEKVKEQDLAPAIGEVLWKVAEDSANYSFNKSHSISYAILAAITVYLKFKYPKEFFYASLKLSKYQPDPHETINKISQEVLQFGIELLYPDLAKSKLDFSIEGDNIRFGLNAIKGVSEKSLEALAKFRESDTPTKFDIFIAAKQAGINIGLLSALIQAGTLKSYRTNRTRLVLEAQSFNLLTDKEKAFACDVGEKYNYDILDIVSKCAVENKVKRSDGRDFMTEKRLATFRNKYNNYKRIYEQNKEHQKFANWVYENNLLGYTPSIRLKTVFKQESDHFTDCLQLVSTDMGELVKMVAEVEDVYKGKSRKSGSKYYRIKFKDETGNVMGLLMDTARGKRLTQYEDKGNKCPEKGDIVIFTARKGEDIMWLESMAIQNDKIFMKLSDTK